MINEAKEQVSLMERMGESVTRHNFLKDFSPNTKNRAPLVPVNETNAKRILDRHTKSGYVIVSPCRGYNDFGLNPETDKMKLNAINNRRIKEFYKEILESGFSFTPSYGGFVENQGTDDEETVYEKSFIIYPFTKSGEAVDFKILKDFVLNAAKKYNQDSVLVAEPGKTPKYITQTGDVDYEFGDGVTFNDVSQSYFTDLHKNTHKTGLEGSPTRFSFTESFINPAPQCLSESVVRGKNGEIFIPYLKG